jgi:phage terminase small subunit
MGRVDRRCAQGTVAPADRQLLTNYVVLADRFEPAAIAQNALDAGSAAPMLMRGSPTVIVSPYIRIMNQATMLMNTLQAKLAFTPSARARLGVPGSGFAQPASAHEMFDTILPDGKVITYGRR